LERYAPDYDPVAFTLVEMVAACVGFTAIALARGDLSVPHGWTVWGALLVTGVFASAFAFLVQTWAQRRGDAARRGPRLRAGLGGSALAGYRLAAAGWAGCLLILAGIVVSEPAAASALARRVREQGSPRRPLQAERRG